MSTIAGAGAMGVAGVFASTGHEVLDGWKRSGPDAGRGLEAELNVKLPAALVW